MIFRVFPCVNGGVNAPQRCDFGLRCAVVCVEFVLCLPQDASLTPRPLFVHAVLVFDWDDTLLCSSWLATNGFRLDYPDVIPVSVTKQLEALQTSVVALLKRAQTYGKVMIITNAETGWVELSAKRFMPEVLPHLADLDVFSARSNFESLSPDSPSEWKVRTVSLVILHVVPTVLARAPCIALVLR